MIIDDDAAATAVSKLDCIDGHGREVLGGIAGPVEMRSKKTLSPLARLNAREFPMRTHASSEVNIQHHGD